MFDQLTAWLYELARAYGYPGVFAISLLSSAIIFIPLPYLLVIFWLSAPALGLNPVFLALISASGATLAKMLIYSLGSGSRKLLSEDKRDHLEFARLVVDRYGAFAVFLFAATPSPDDALYVPLGMMRYSMAKFFVSCLMGKILLTLMVTWGGYFAIGWIGHVFAARGGMAGVAVTLAFILASVYVTLKIDWQKLFAKRILKKEKSR